MALPKQTSAVCRSCSNIIKESTAKKEKRISSENDGNLNVIFQKLQRIEPFAVFAHLKMQVRPG